MPQEDKADSAGRLFRWSHVVSIAPIVLAFLAGESPPGKLIKSRGENPFKCLIVLKAMIIVF